MLFKILHGDKSRISTDITPYHEGYCYVTHDGDFYVDMNNERVKLNAKDAETLLGASLNTILNSSNLEIPTSKAVLDALAGKAEKEHAHDDIYVTKTELGDELDALFQYMLDDAIENASITFSCTERDDGSLSYSLVYPPLESGETAKSTLVSYLQYAKSNGLIVSAQLQDGNNLINSESINIHYSSENVIGTIYFSFVDRNTRYFLQVGGDYPNGSGYKEDVVGIDAGLVQEGSAADAKATGEAIKSSVADWNQNDETALDYVKNRTHWEETNYVEIVSGSVTLGNGATQFSEQIIKLTPGKTYLVTVNGIEYNCVAIDGTTVGGTADDFLLGNISMTGLGENTGEPFVIMFYHEMGAAIVMFDGSTTATISVVDKQSDIHKLDNKFLDLAWIPVTEKGTVCIDEQKVLVGEIAAQVDWISEDVANKINNSEIQVGDIFVVSFDGVRYECPLAIESVYNQSRVVLGNLSLIDESASNTGEPFVVWDIENPYVWTETKVEHTIMVCYPGGDDEVCINKIPEVFLPNTVLNSVVTAEIDTIKDAKADWNQNDETALDYIKNRPFWEERTLLIAEQTVTVEPYTLATIDTNAQFIEGNSYEVTFNGETFVLTAQLLDEADFGDPIILGNPSILYSRYKNTGHNFVFLYNSPDLVRLWTKDIGSTSHTFSINEIDIHTIDPKYIKDMYYEGNPIETVMVEEQTVVVSEDNLYLALTCNIQLTIGKTYIINFNGAKYECVAYELYGAPVIGNASLIEGDGGNNEPFLIVGDYNFLYCENGGTYTFSISAMQPEIVKIDKKYLPEKYMTQSDLNTKQDSLTSLNWNDFTPPINGRLQSVTYGNNMFVVIAYNSDKAIYSKDGINWEVTTLPVSENWQSVTYGNGIFVAVASGSNDSKVAAYSTDGINWTETTMPIQKFWNSVTYGNGMFVAVSSSSDKAAYSTDGVNWAEANMPSRAGWKSVTYGNGMFVAVAMYSNKAAYSTDGVNWTATTLPADEDWVSVTYGNDIFIVRAENAAASSTDGINWTEIVFSVDGSWGPITYGNGMFVAVPLYCDTAICSIDGINWIASSLPGDYWNSVAYGNGMFIAVTYNRIACAKTLVVFASSFRSETIKLIDEYVPSSVPEVTTSDNGKFLRVVDGVWAAATVPNAEEVSF